MGLAEDIAEVFGDFELFCGLVDIRTKNRGIIQLSRDTWFFEQAKFQAERTGLDVVIKPRQIGFTTIELARDMHFALTHEGVNVLVVVHDNTLKKQLFSNVRVMADGLRKLGLLPATRYDTTDELVFAKTASAIRIVEAGATERSAASKGRSGTIHRLHATEMAFWGAAEDTWTALESAVPSTGEVVIESTANGAGGLFYSMVKDAQEGRGRFKLHFFPWFEHVAYASPPRVGFDPEPRDAWELKLRARGCNDRQIQWWRDKCSGGIPLDKVLQENPPDIESAFRMVGRGFFEPELIDTLFEHARKPLRIVPLTRAGKSLGELHVFEEPVQGERYVVGGDVSEGTGLDTSTMVVLERKSARVVATLQTDSLEPGDLGLAMAEVGTMYGRAQVAPERNNHGHAAIRALLHEARYGNVWMAPDGKHGWSTDAVTRPVMIDELGAAARTGIARPADRRIVSEMKTLVRNEKGKVEARGKGSKDGCKDDLWMAYCIAFAVRSQPEFGYKAIKIPGL